VFHRLLDRYFDGVPDEATLQLLAAGEEGGRGGQA